MFISKSKRNSISVSANFVLAVGIWTAFSTGAAKLGGQSHLSSEESEYSFEVATIRPSVPDSVGLSYGLTPSNFKAKNATLAALIQFGYNLSEHQLASGPAWINSEKFDIDAKISGSDIARMQKASATEKFENYRELVKSLLSERFNLRTHTRMEVQPACALVIAKVGERASALIATPEVKGATPSLTGGSKGELHAHAISMSTLANWLSGRPDVDERVVVNATGLQGNFDFVLKWSPMESPPSPTSSSEAMLGPSLFTAIREQLGLKLEPRKLPAQVLIIDKADRPSAN